MRRRRFSLSSSTTTTTTKKSSQSNNNNSNSNSNSNRGGLNNNTHNFDNNTNGLTKAAKLSPTTTMGSPKTKSKSKTEAADKFLAATAGVDNWKTWAGRAHGDENFELLDIFRGVKRTIQHKLFTNKPPPGTQCPVCFCEPAADDDWYVTSSCFHAVCLDCLHAYTKNQVYDPNQVGPLRCPVCPQVLRPTDAIIALGGNKQLIQQWDLKIRNQLLRALPAFRHCPHCSSSSSSTKTSTEGGEEKEEAAVASSDDTINVADTTTTTDNTGFGGGGGFVTPECLGPKYEERRETSIKVLYMLPLSSIGLMLLWIVMTRIISKTPSNSPIIDLVFMFLPIPTFIKVGTLANTWIAQEARKRFLKPLKVECPCCDEEFILPAESESYLNDSETSRWIESNTRPCPSCSSPIHKDGGCNHMQCSHCKANFCWACMRLRTNCGAYACRNGAPYRNAVPMPIENSRQRRLPTINVNTDNPLEVIDYILDREQQRPTKLNWMTDGLLLIYAIFIRHFGPFQKGIEVVTAVISSLLTSGIVTSMVALYVAKLTYDRIRIQNIQRHQRHAYRNGHDHHHHNRRRQQQQQRRQRNHHDRGNNNLTASEMLLGIEERNERQRHHNMNNMMTEEEMVAEATRRSLVEQ